MNSVDRIVSAARRMSRQDHLGVTAGKFRHELVSAAVVTEKTLMSPTVFSLTLKVEDSNFGFHAGQWQVR